MGGWLQDKALHNTQERVDSLSQERVHSVLCSALSEVLGGTFALAPGPILSEGRVYVGWSSGGGEGGAVSEHSCIEQGCVSVVR